MTAFKLHKGINADVVRMISHTKNEPLWMTELRLRALIIFEQKPLPVWGADLSNLDHNDIHYYVKVLDDVKHSWDDVPEKIKQTFERLGIPQAERKLLAGVGAQYESEVIYKSLHESLRAQGVIFCDMNTALREHAELFVRYFGTVIPAHDNKFAALNSAVWSGGSFVYVPKNVRIEQPLQAYFRINTPNMGQFERTLIIAEPGSFVHYVEGCSAPVYRSNALHSAVVEIIAHEHAHVRYTTIQNWSENVYNLVTKRAIAHEYATVEWIDGNFGSKVTMKYPAIILKGRGAKGTVISLAVASRGQHQDAGAKIIHRAPETTSTIIAKSISKEGGHTSYRGLVKVLKGSKRARSIVQCDALMLDPQSRSDTYPTVDIKEPLATVGHEASVSKVSDEQLFYLMSRGLTQAQAQTMIINGFIDCFVSILPMEYAVEINRLMALEMEGSIG
jgi:Fe-S cluster assembly protein SufB